MKTTLQARIREALSDPILQDALDRNAKRRREGRRFAFQSLDNSEELIVQAGEIRRQTLTDLDHHVDQFLEMLEKNGIQTHHAADDTEATEVITRIAKQHAAQLVAKSKSMVTEEIGLNQILEGVGIEVVETDLGEFIVQLRGEPPAHIITPAIHLLKDQVGRTFQENLGVPYTTDVERMTEIAREKLRTVFQRAQIGISGVNFGVAETGTLCLVTNEGNGRMVTQLPPVHIAVMGMERLVPTLDDLCVMLQLLPRSATGQKISSYVSLLNSPNLEVSPGHLQERHLILLDNGRNSLRNGPLHDSLLCIRCGACLNACPVFQEIGGHAYGSVYPGPIGSILSPGLFGMHEFSQLARTSTLCGACDEVCPVGIDLTILLLRVRNKSRQHAPIQSKMGIKLFTWAARSPTRFRFAQRLAWRMTSWLPKRENWIRSLPSPFSGWTMARDFPPFQPQPYTPQPTKDLKRLSRTKMAPPNRHEDIIQPKEQYKDLVSLFLRELEAIDGEYYICSQRRLTEMIRKILEENGCQTVLRPDPQHPWSNDVENRLRDHDVLILDHPARFPIQQPDRKRAFKVYDEANVGITSAWVAFADTGSIVLRPESIQDTLASLLAPIHIAVLATSDIYSSMSEWVGRQSPDKLDLDVCVISGPSRTADIEMTLTLGVHGPARLIVICMEDEEPTLK